MVVPSDPTYAPPASDFTRASTQVTLLPEDRPGRVRRALEIEMQDRRRPPVPRFDQAAQQQQQADSTQDEEQPRPTALLGDLLCSIPRSAAAGKQLRALRSWGAAHAAAFSLPADQASIDSIPSADLFSPGEAGDYPSLQALVMFGKLKINGRTYSSGGRLAASTCVKRLRCVKSGLALPAVQGVFSGSGQRGSDDGLTELDRQGLIAALDDAIKAAQREMAAAQAAGDGGDGGAVLQPAGSEQDDDGLPAQQPAQQPEQQPESSHSAGCHTQDTGAAAAQPRQPAVPRFPATQERQQQPAASVAASSPAPMRLAGHKRNLNQEQQHARVNRARAEQAADDAAMADAPPAAGAAAGSPVSSSAHWEMLKKLDVIQAGLLRVVPGLLHDKAQRRQRFAQVEAAMRALRWLKDLDEQDDLLSRFGFVLTWHSLPAVYTAAEVLGKFDRAVGKVAEAVGGARWQQLLDDVSGKR